MLLVYLPGEQLSDVCTSSGGLTIARTDESERLINSIGSRSNPRTALFSLLIFTRSDYTHSRRLGISQLSKPTQYRHSMIAPFLLFLSYLLFFSPSVLITKLDFSFGLFFRCLYLAG